MEERVDESAVVARVYIFSAGRCRSGAGVDHHAGGLVDDGEVLVFVEDVEGYVLGEGMEGWRVGCAFDLDGLAAVEFLFGFGGGSVDPDLVVLDEELDACAGDVGDGLGEILIKAQAGSLGGGSEAMGRVFGVVVD